MRIVILHFSLEHPAVSCYHVVISRCPPFTLKNTAMSAGHLCLLAANCRNPARKSYGNKKEFWENDNPIEIRT